MLDPRQEALLAQIRGRGGNPYARISMQDRAAAGGMPVPAQPSPPPFGPQPPAPAAMAPPAGPTQVKVAGAQGVGAPPPGSGGPQMPPAPPQGPPSPPPAPAAGILESMDDKTAAMFMGLGDKERQMKFAEMLRDQGPASGTHVNQGRTFVAASPIEHGVRAYGMFKGRRDGDRIGREQTEGRMGILNLLRGR